MLKRQIGPLLWVFVMAAHVCSCGGSSGGSTGIGGAAGGSAGTASTTGDASASGAAGTGGHGDASATGGTGGTSGTGGTGGMSTLTLAQACMKNCTLAAGLAGCSTTMDVCVKSCLTTFDNTSNVNAALGRQYTAMMICIATTPKFASAADFVCAKPDRALNKWSPGPDSDCEQLICDWNCADGTMGNFDPFIDIRCACSSV
jgi:hypothetical protein